jgi:hypothetical protein
LGPILIIFWYGPCLLGAQAGGRAGLLEIHFATGENLGYKIVLSIVADERERGCASMVVERLLKTIVEEPGYGGTKEVYCG